MTPCRLRELIAMGFTISWKRLKIADKMYKTSCKG